MDVWTPGRLISTLYRRCQRQLDRRFAEAGIDGGRGLYLYLTELARQDGTTQSDLARRLALDPASVTRSLRRLEALEWVVRREGADGRERHVFLAPAGRAALPRIAAILDEWDEMAASGFSSREREQFEALLGRMAKNTEEEQRMTRNWLNEARALDEADLLKEFRSRFHLPQEGIYMDGNSLGLASVDALSALERATEEWRTRGIGGWLEAKPDWFTYGERIGSAMAPLVGAHTDEVVMAGSTTSNLHSLVATFYTPKGERRKILADELNFPSDLYALESQVRLKGGDPARDLLLAKSADGRTLDEESLIALMDETVALALLPGVLYRSGQLLDMRRLAKAAHERGVVIGFDCAHSVGSVPHKLHEDDVDFAFWCCYKHLNGGPGAPAGLFVNRRHFERAPGLAGWYGYVKERQFDMSISFEHSRDAGGWQMGTPGVLSAASLDGALKVFAEAGIDAVREKSLALTGFMIEMVDERLAPLGYEVGTPREPKRRGGHIAVEHPEAWRICCALKKRGIIPDFRPPMVIRLAPVALYNTFEDVERTVSALETIVKGREYEAFSSERSAVS